MKQTIKPIATVTAIQHVFDKSPSQPVFDRLPDSAFVRESQLVRSPKNPDSAVAPLPFSAPTLWRKVKDGSFPQPIRCFSRITCWKVSDVRAWMASQTA
jgi:predicted DNA-binding transcriptional regulator AlpA